MYFVVMADYYSEKGDASNLPDNFSLNSNNNSSMAPYDEEVRFGMSIAVMTSRIRPVICLLGMFGNILNIIILIPQGKSRNLFEV